MKLFEQRMRVSWSNLILGLIPTSLALFAVITNELLIPGRPSMGGTRVILKKSDPDHFAFVLGSFIALAAIAWFFSFFRFRRGTWFNPT
jgi:hypothetical protein